MHHIEDMRTLYRWLADTRALCKVLIENRPKIHGPLLTDLGQEAIGVGIVWALWQLGIAENSWKFGSHRSMWGLVAAMSHICGEDLAYEFIKNHFLKATSPNRGRDGNTHIGFPQHRIGGFDLSHMGAMMGVAVGTAEALRHSEFNGVPENRRPVTIFCCGEGASQQGIVHEAMNWVAAANAKLSAIEMVREEKFLDEIGRATGIQRGCPFVFVMEVNGKSIFVDPREEHGNAHIARPSHLAQRALGYPGWIGMDVDGDNAMEIANAVQIAARRAQRLEGATLIVAHTYRRTPHNEDQKPMLSEEEKHELEASWETEPLKKLRRDAVAQSLLSDTECDEIEREAYDHTHALSQRALREPDVSLEDHRKDTARFAPHVYTLGEIMPTKENAKPIFYKDATLMVVREILQNDPRALFYGEDIAHPSGGVLGLWRGLLKEFGNGRVCNTPISEEMIAAFLAGASFAGMRPWGEFEFAPFGDEAAVQIKRVIAPAYYQKRRQYPLVLLNHFGIVGDGGSGEFHSDCTELDFYQTQGWKVVFPADAYDVAGLLRAAHEDPNPVVVYLQIYARSKPEFRRPVPNEPYMIPLGKAAVKREGKDCTVVAYGACAVQAALNEAEALAKEGIDLEVVDLRTLVPFDRETVARSVIKTGHLLIMHEASLKKGVGAYIKEDLTSDPLLWGIICNPVKILSAHEEPIPIPYELEWERLPFNQATTAGIGGRNETILRSAFLAKEVREAMKY